MNDFVIQEITDKNKELINDVADIHLATFKGFFLTFMGIPIKVRKKPLNVAR